MAKVQVPENTHGGLQQPRYIPGKDIQALRGVWYGMWVYKQHNSGNKTRLCRPSKSAWKVLHKLAESGLKVNTEKSFFGCTQTNYLGF